MQIFKYESIDSTFSESGRAAPALKEGEYLFLANEQTHGRGQRDHSFVSPRGNGIYATLLIKGNFDISITQSLTPLAAVCVTEVFSAFRHGLTIKWINDLHIGGKKYGGVLSAASIENGRVRALRVGFGINLGEAPTIQTAATLKLEGGFEYDALAMDIAANISSSLRRNIYDEYISLCTTVGRSVAFRNGDVGTAVEICRDYSLNVLMPCGNIVNLKNTYDISIL